MAHPLVTRLAALSARARHGARPRSRSARLATIATLTIAGFLISSSALAARGQDLRPSRNVDLVTLVRGQADHNVDLTARLTAARADVNALTKAEQPDVTINTDLDIAADVAAQTPVRGPAITVTLADAPITVKPISVSEDLLIVHQQDIQAVVNALWSGGAEAMTIQGQRVTSRTGVKCVGNTVVLHGVPYAPPYAISAIGNQAKLEASLSTSDYLVVYRQYADAYGLGYAQKRVPDASFPGASRGIELAYARPR